MRLSRTAQREPERLSAQDPELKRALRALADADAPSSAELRRMGQRLQVVFEAPAPKHGALLRSARGSLGFSVLGGVLIMASVGALRIAQPRGADSQAAMSQLPTPSQAAPTLPEPSEPTARMGSELSTQATAPATPQRSVATASKRHRAHAALPVAPLAAVGGDKIADTPAAISSIPSHPSNAGVVQAPSQPARAPADASVVPARAAAPQLDEAALLQQARQLARSQPEAALRVLSEHQRRFAQGMLSPEREVLAIELLRSLSRGDEAHQRLQSFRQRYPKSVYLKRFER